MFLAKSSFWSRVKPAPAEYPPDIQAEREALRLALIHSNRMLATMWVREGELRTDFLSALEMLGFQVEMAHFKVNTRTWDDATLDAIFAEMKEKETALLDQLREIRLAQLEIRDAQKIYDDPECWTPDATEQLAARRKAVLK